MSQLFQISVGGMVKHIDQTDEQAFNILNQLLRGPEARAQTQEHDYKLPEDYEVAKLLRNARAGISASMNGVGIVLQKQPSEVAA